MIPSSLQEIFSTVSVGLLVTVIATTLYWMAFTSERTFTHWFAQREWRPQKDRVLLPLLFIFGIYSIGLIIEGITDHLVDSEHEPDTQWLPSWHDETDLRLSTVIKSGSFSPPRNDGESSGYSYEFLRKEKSQPIPHNDHRIDSLEFPVLGKAIISDIHHCYAVHPRGNETEFFREVGRQIVRQRTANIAPISDFSYGDLKALMGRSYYQAKNWAYSKNTYFDELRIIQNRIDFARSARLVLWISLRLTLIAIAIFLLRSFSPQVRRVWKQSRRLVKERKKKNTSAAKSDTSAVSKRPGGSQISRLILLRSRLRRNVMVTRLITRVGKGAFFFVFLILIAIASHRAWHHAENNFNERAWGYHLSALERGEVYLKGYPQSGELKECEQLLSALPDSSTSRDSTALLLVSP